MFGDPLSEAALPMINQLVENIQNHGLETVGIFRVSATASLVSRLQDEYRSSNGKPLDPSRITSPVVAATLLKQYCRSLPSPLIPSVLYNPLVAVMGMSNEEIMVEMYRSLLQTLPVLNRKVLQMLVVLFELIVDRAEVNKMTGSSLGLVVGPALLRPENSGNGKVLHKPSPAIAAVICDIVDHQEELFANPHEEPAFVLVSRAMFDFQGGDDPIEHPFKKGDYIFLSPEEEGMRGWREGTIAGQESVSGLFPGNYLEVILDIEDMHSEAYGLAVPEGAVDQATLVMIEQLKCDLHKEQCLRAEMNSLLQLLATQYSDLKTKVYSTNTNGKKWGG